MRLVAPYSRLPSAVCIYLEPFLQNPVSGSSNKIHHSMYICLHASQDGFFFTSSVTFH